MEYNSVEYGSGWSVMLLGWPAVFAAALALSWAAAYRSRGAAIVGLVLAAPMFLYLTATPRFQWSAPVAFALLGVFAWRVRESGWLTLALLALPAAIVLIWLAYAVATQ